MRVHILHDVVVSPNLSDGANVTCCFPSTCTPAGGGVVVLYRRGQTKHSADGVLLSQRSEDRGATWSAPAVVFDGMQGQPPESVVIGMLGATADGTLLACFPVVAVTDPTAYVFSDAGRQQRQRALVVASRDGGRTWGPPREHRFEGLPELVYFGHKPLLLADGDLLCSMEATGDKKHQYTFTARYTPGRGAFHTIAPIGEDPTGRLSYGDTKLTALPDRRVLALTWVFVTATEENIDIHRSESADGGRSWSPPAPVGLRSQVTTPLSLGPGLLIAAGNVRTPPDGIRLWASRDDGRTWDPAAIQMWDPRAGRVIGEQLEVGTGESGKVWEALPGFTFGTPDLVRLDDGSVLLTYYATVNGIIHVRACRIEVEV